MPDWIGYRWLIGRFGLNVTQPRLVETAVGPTRASVRDGITEQRTVQALLRPRPTLAGHLAFALKHEGVHLETLSRLFAVAPQRNWRHGFATSLPASTRAAQDSSTSS